MTIAKRTLDGIKVSIPTADGKAVMYEALFKERDGKLKMVRNVFCGPDGNLVVRGVRLSKEMRKEMYAAANFLFREKQNEGRAEQPELGGCGCMFFARTSM